MGEIKDYGRFIIEWTQGLPPNYYVTIQLERQIVQEIGFLTPKLYRYGMFIRDEYRASGILLAFEVYHNPDNPDFMLDFWYDHTADVFGLHIKEWANDTILGSVRFPDEIVL